MTKELAMLLSVFLPFKFLSKDLIIAALTAYTTSATLPCIKRFLTKECNYKGVVSPTLLIHISVDFIKPQVAASIPGFFFCMWYAAMNYCLANNVFGISSCIQGIEMISPRSHKTGVILLLLFADAVSPSSILTIGDSVMPGTFVALALRIAVTRVSKKCFFNCAFLLYIVGSTVIIIIMNWFQAAQDGEPDILHVAPGVIGFVTVYCFWNGEVKLDGMNQLMGKVWDWNMYGTKLKKFDGSVLAANEDGGRCEDDDTAPREDRGDDPKDGSSGPESSEDNDDWQGGPRVVQFLSISANFPIRTINCYDYMNGRCIYADSEGEVQEDGMVDLVPTGPRELIMAYGLIGFEIFYYTTAGDEGDIVSVDEGGLRPLGPPILVQWNVDRGEEIKNYIQTICEGPHKLEVTYLLIPEAVQISVEVRLKLKDFGSRSRAVYGKIKANAIDYGNKSVHLFNCDRGRRLSFPSGTTSILPLRPSKFALPCSRLLKFHIEVDLTVITTCDSHEEDKNLKFSLEFTRGIITSQKREVDDDHVEVEIEKYLF